MADKNNIIPNGLRADVMRNKMENKDALQGDGYIYIGTGNKIKIEADGNTYEIPETTGMDIREVITKYGAKALSPISISSKDQLVNTDGTLTELAKKSFAYTVYDSSVKLQDADAANYKEEVIIPAWSKGMVLSSGNDLLVTYGGVSTSGSFFYTRVGRNWTIVKANIANILDSATMKTTNDGLIPKTTNSVNLGSINNMWGNLYVQNVGSTAQKVSSAVIKDITAQNIGTELNPVSNAHIDNINAHEIKSDAVAYDGSGNIDNTKCHYFAVPEGKTQSFGTITLPPNTKGDISSSGGDCCLWYATMANADSVAGFLTYNSSTSGGWYKSAIEAPYFNATSDKRLKENIVPFTSEKSVLDLPVYTFNFKSDKNKKKHVGCLAQDLQEICPDLVNEDSQGYLSIEESKITYLLLEEVKELKKQVEELEEKINELEGK